MLAYIWIRFEWPFAVGAIATLMLDVTKVVGFFALTGIDFNLTAIAALLTLVGYSVNDKVVVYDRMRENMRLYKAMPLRDLIDKSINETLGAQPLHLGDRVSRHAADGDLGRRGGRELRRADGVRHRGRRELVDLHRGADPAVPRRLAHAAAEAAGSGPHPGMNRSLFGKFANVASGTRKLVESRRCGLAAIQALSEIDW